MRTVTIGIIILIVAGVLCAGGILPAIAEGGSGNNPNPTKYGNCLSFPVIWAEGVTKVLRGAPGVDPILNGEWWYWWGTDLEGNPLVCVPDPDDNAFCDDTILGTTGPEPGDGVSTIYKGYLQQDGGNTWQAGTSDASADASTVMVETTTIFGNPLVERAYSTDGAPTVFLVNTEIPLTEGILTSIQTYNQPGSGPNTFNAFVLRPTGNANEYTVIFDSGPLNVPVAAGQIETFEVGEIAVQSGDLIAHYGQGIPFDIGPGTDTTLYPASPAPLIDQVITLGADYPIYSTDRTYSIAAEVSTGTSVPTTGRVQVDLIDWGDNLESVDWYTKSKVRTEVSLFEDSTVNSLNDTENEPFPMLQYEMRHLYGLGTDEMWGLSTTINPFAAEEVIPNTQATVYSHCARLTIQKLIVERDDPSLADLIWVPEVGWMEPDGYEVDLIDNEPIYNMPVYVVGDGPTYYSAEINVKGKVMYGYNWDLKKVHGDPADGDYRVTFSFDDYCGLNDQGPPLNTFFTDADGNPVAQMIELVEEEEVIDPDDPDLSTTESEETDGGDVGATGVIDYDNGLTYIDIRIEQQGG
ncbi:MAG: hypothetical protein E4G94_08385 [ANME-2 cluster archaeon]|nr:MAG: hypothetical protein E4G94_08385 [ANME-2 cluster archaeon]